jgi:peptide/nickel transport system permease protein
MKIIKGFAKFWKHSSMRFKIGFCGTMFFLFLGYVVVRFPHENPVLFYSFLPAQPPSFENFLGTTTLGQDIFWLLINAIHNSLQIGLIVATIGGIIGILTGFLAGYLGRFPDRIISVVADTFIVIPALPILILLGSLIRGGGAASSTLMMALALALFAWAWPCRQIRSMALSMRERDFIHTAKFSGQGTLQIIVTEQLPYALTWSLSNFMNATLVAIATESSLAVLGLSPADLVSLGNMIQWARDRNAIFAQHWYWIGSPIVATILLFVFLFMMVTGYNDYLAKRRGR